MIPKELVSRFVSGLFLPILIISELDDERKVFCQQLNQLHISKGLDLKSIAKLSILTEHLNNVCITLFRITVKLKQF